MTTSPSSVPADGNGPELAGSWTDALFGYGLLYLLSVPVIFWLARNQGIEAWPAGIASLLALVIAGPHYAATILRVYEKRHDRRKYAFFAVWVTALLLIFFVYSLHSEPFGSWILTAYVCWSPWHFAGQNFGVSMMSLRRREVPIDELSRRLLHGSFILAFLLSIVWMQTGGTRSEVALGADGANVYHVIRLGIAPDFSLIVLWITGFLYLAATVGALIRLGRNHQARHLGPTISLIATHSLWYVLPVISANRVPLIYSAVWVSTIHSLQYLWVTSYFAKRTDGKPAGTFYWQCLLVGGVLAVTFQLIFAPGLLGRFLPFASDAGIMVFSILNLHHFILDGAIWKLRDGRVGRILLNQTTPLIETSSTSPGRGFFRPAVYVIGVLSLMTPFYFLGESQLAIHSESHRTSEKAAERLSFWGKEIPGVHASVARHRNLAGNPEGAIEAFRRELALDPNNPIAAAELAGLLLDDPMSARESLALAAYASEAMDNSNPVVLIILGSAHARVGQLELARAAFTRAERIALTEGRSKLANISQAQLQLLE